MKKLMKKKKPTLDDLVKLAFDAGMVAHFQLVPNTPQCICTDGAEKCKANAPQVIKIFEWLPSAPVCPKHGKLLADKARKHKIQFLLINATTT
jgi:hypothetical protein